MSNLIVNTNERIQKLLSTEISVGEQIERSIAIADKLDWNSDGRWLAYMNNETDESHRKSRMSRMNERLDHDCAVKPCGRECHDWGFKIIIRANHASMKNSKELVNDKEFLYRAAKITPAPNKCESFFYEYVNKYLKRNKEFRIQFLRSLFLNENVLTRNEIEWFVTTYGFEKEYEVLRQDCVLLQDIIANTVDAMRISESLKIWNTREEKMNKTSMLKALKKINNIFILRALSLISCFEDLRPDLDSNEFNEEIMKLITKLDKQNEYLNN